VKGQFEDSFDERFGERFGERLSKKVGERFGKVCGRKPNMLQEYFNLSKLPSPYKGLVFLLIYSS
jgi:hypothetical protein